MAPHSAHAHSLFPTLFIYLRAVNSSAPEQQHRETCYQRTLIWTRLDLRVVRKQMIIAESARLKTENIWAD